MKTRRIKTRIMY